MNNLVLIDKRVTDYAAIVDAIDISNGAHYIVFDIFELGADPFAAIQTKISELNIPAFNSIGLVQHNYNEPFYQMFGPACSHARIMGVETSDASLQTWQSVTDFITLLKTTYGIQHFDLMACALYSDPNWKYVIDTLSVQTGVTIRASADNTGSAGLGGNWFLESHTGVNMKGVYFTEAIEEYRGVLLLDKFFIRQYPTTKGISIGSVVFWDYYGGGDLSANLGSDVVAVYSGGALAALKSNGSVVTWGDPRYGGNSSIATYSYSTNSYTYTSVANSLSSDVVAVYSAGGAFAALKSNGSVVTWGSASAGGNSSIATYSPSTRYTYTSVENSLSSDVVAVYATYSMFAALKSNGSVITWGEINISSSVSDNISSGVVAVYSTGGAFAALKSNGSVVTWGSANSGGDSSSVINSLSSGVVAIYSSASVFAALKSNGSVVTWGNPINGGNSSIATYSYSTNSYTYTSVASSLSSGVVAVYAGQSAFAALKSNGSVVTWGNYLTGGSLAMATGSIASGVVGVCSSYYGFAALKIDGSVVEWGTVTETMGANNTRYFILLSGYSRPQSNTLASNVVAIYGSSMGFAALKSNGTIIYWGYNTNDSGLNSDIVAFYYNCALTSNGSVINIDANLHISFASVSNSLSSDVVAIFPDATTHALKSTATTFDLSMSYYTDMDRYNILRKKENRRRVNLTTLNNNVFTLSNTHDIQSFNPNIPSDKILRIIVPDYLSSPLSMTSTATIPYSSGSYIIASDEGEHVTISGVTYVNYGSYVYKRETNNTYTKLTTTTINENIYSVYGGDGINSSGIALVTITTTYGPFTPPAKTLGDAVFSMVPYAPTSDSIGAYTYTSSLPDVATINSTGTIVTIVGVGSTTITVSQDACGNYPAGSKTGTLAVTYKTVTYGTFTPPAKTIVDAPFSMVPYAPTTDSNGAYTYTSSAPGVATISTDGTVVTIVGQGSTTITASQDICGNYSASSKTGVLTISGLTTTYGTFTPPAKTFGDAAFSMVPFAPTTDNNGVYTYTSSAPGVATINSTGTVVTIIGQGSTTITASQDICGNYAAGSQTGTLTVARKSVTYGTFTPPAKTFGDAAFSLVPFAPTTDNNGVYTYTSSAPSVATINSSGTVVTIVGQGSTTITVSQDICGNYLAGTQTGTLTVARKAVTYGAFTPPAKTFGDVPFSLVSFAPTTDNNGAYTYTSSAPEVATISTDGTVVTIVGQGSTTITVSQDISGNYAAGSKTGTLTVARKAVTYGTFTPPEKTFGDAAFSLVPFAPTTDNNSAYIYTSSAPGVATISTDGTVVTIVGQGSTTITVSQDICGNYAAGSKTATLTVAGITITYGAFTPPAKTFGDVPFSLVPFAPTTTSNGAYIYTSSAPGVATINSTGTVVTIVGQGSTTITASQDICGNYAAGSQTGTLTVARKTTTYGAFTPPAKTLGDVPFSMATYAPTTDNNGVYTYISSAPEVATINSTGTVVTIVGLGSTTITASQDICGNYLAGSQTGTLTVTYKTTIYGAFTPPAKTFGAAPFSMVPFAPTTTSNGAYTYTSSAPEVATISTDGTVVTIVGQGSTTITVSQDICGNYAAGSKTGTLTVARKATTYGTFTPPAKTFGDAAFSLVPFAPTTDNNSAYIYTSSAPSVATISTDGTVVTIVGQGSTTITVSQDICGNYAAGSKTGVLAVARKATTYGTFTPPAKTFGAVPFSLVSFAPTTDNNGAYTYTSSAPGVATINSTGTVVTIIGQGSTTITASQDICGNYLAGSTTGTLTVARAIPTYNAVSSFTKTYGNPSFSLVPYMSGISNSNGSYTFTSSNPSAVSIDGDGVTANILAYSSSAVTITANQDVCGNYTSGTKTFSLTVLRRTPTVSGLVNQTRPLTPASFTLSPVSSSTGTFSYVSDNTDVVFMTNDGTTFNVASIGSATITATITQDPSGNYKSQTYNFVISVILATSNLAAATFAVPVLMTYGDTPVNITTVPTSDSNGDITYTSSNINIATIHPTTGVITAIGSGWVTFTASQAATSVYNANSVNSNNMNVVVKSVTQSRVAPYTSTTITKYYGDAPFQIETTSDSNANKLFSLSNLSVVSLVNSSNIANITITNVGTVTITGQQYTNSQYSTQNSLGWDLTVEKGSTTLSGLAATLNKNVTDEAFTVSVTSASSGVISYALSNPDSSNVLIVNSVSGLVTLKSAGTATIVASQAASSFYNAPESVSCVITVVGAGSSLQGDTITSGRVFDNVDMTGASLSGSTVIGASFAGTIMTNADLSGATVRNVTLTGANLVNAALSNADISGTSFSDATMSNVIMTGATVTNSTLSSVNLTGASMANANITGTTFADSTMTNAVLTGATLTNSTLTNTDLSGASLARVNVTGSSFVGATLANADLSGATVTNANFTNTNISGANITNVAFSPLQKIQLLKNINNRAISEIQVGEVNGSVILSAISGSSLATTIPNLASSTVKVIIPMTSTVSSDIITDIVLDLSVSDKFYFPINDGEYFQILGVKYFINGSIVRNATTNGVVDVIPYGSKYIWLSVGSLIMYVLQVNTLSESTFTVPSNKNDTNAPFNITTVPSSNSNAAIVYSSNNPSVATIHPSTGVITIVAMGDVSFNATQSQTFLYEAGSVTSNTLHVSNILINFTLSGLDQTTLMMSICGRLDASAVYLSATDATAVFYVKLSDMREIFKYQSDSFDINDISASDIKYYVFNRNWPTALKINPAHAMLDKTESSGMLGNTTLFNSANSMAKHDFVRYLAKKLFNTIFAVSLFNNTTALLENATEGGEDIRSNMNSVLSSISTTSADETMAYDASGNKYLTNDTTSNTNICRELIRQVAVTAASRFSSVTDTTLPQSVPFIENDTINFRVSFHSTATQHLLTDVTNISARSYMVKLIMKESIDGLNTPVIDSAMFPNAYPYSSAVTTYAPTSASSNVYNIFSPPAPIPFSRFGFDGWYYTNSSAWVNINSNVRNHVKWLLPANSETATVGGLLYIRANLKIHNKTTLPYIVVYTQSGSWRKFPIVNTEALVNGTTYSFYVNFHLYTRQPVMNGYTNAALANTIGSGPFDSSEIILNIALETDSSAAEDSVEFTLATMIVGDDSGEKEYGFMADVPTAYP